MKRWMAVLLAAALIACLPLTALGEHEKVVYLTFDDGPKKDTPELLALLEELDVPATFFLVGLSVRAFPEYAKMIVDAGYPVGCHSMSHSYTRIKSGNDYVERDLARFNAEMEAATGEAFSTDLYRFPGGSTRYSSSTKNFVAAQGYAWFDWNAMTGDAQYTFKSDAEMYDYTLSTIKDREVVILLMHDGKQRTRNILPDLVTYFRENGFEFRTLSTSEEEQEILSRCSANMMFPTAQ